MANSETSLAPSLPPTRETMKRCSCVLDSGNQTFFALYKNMSVLRGRSIREYCLEDNAPGYVRYVFAADCDTVLSDDKVLADKKLLYKLCKYACGLPPREDPVWKTADTLEYFINFVWSKAGELSGAGNFTDQSLNQQLDELQLYLGRILDEVEERKNLYLGDVKRKILKAHRKKARRPSTTLSCYCDVPYMYTILTQNLIHRVFIMTFKQLNCLKGKCVHTYLKEECKFLRPMVSFTHEEKHILKNLDIAQSEEIHINLLYKLLQRVCCLLDHREWATSPDTLEYSLFCIKQDHDNTALMDEQTYRNRSDQLYKNLEKILDCVAKRSGKTKQELVRQMPVEPMCLYKSSHKLLESQSPDDSRFPSSPRSSSFQTTQQLESSSDPTQQPASSSDPTQQPVPSPDPTQQPVPSPDPTQQPVPSPDPTQHPVPSSDPTQQPVPSPDPTQHPVPSSDPTQQPVPSPDPTQQPVPSPDPTQQPVPSSDPTQHPVPSSQTQQGCSSVLPSQKVKAFSTFRIEDINVVCLFKALCAGGIAARTMAIVYTAFSGDIDNVDPSVKKQILTAAELSHVQGDVTHLDITLLYKLLRFACTISPPYSPVWTTNDDTLEYLLNHVKKMRNDMVHEVNSLTNDDLKTNIQTLEGLLENILLKTSSRTQKDMQDEIRIMKDEIQPLAHPPPLPLDRDSYHKVMEELRRELTNQMVLDASQELLNKYRKASSINASPVTWCYNDRHNNITIDKLFTDLEIVDVRNENALSEEDIISLQKNEGMRSRIIVVQGVTGAGKTCLCKFLVHLWSSGKKQDNLDAKKQTNLEGIELLIHIQCKYVTSPSLSSFLRKTLPNTFKNIDKEDVIPLMQELRVLFLVDGYDEAGKDAKDLVKDILASLPDSKMIITSRPPWVPKLQYEIHQTTSHCTVLSVAGFKEGHRNQYIRKFFSVMLEADPEQKMVCDKFLDYLSKFGEELEALTQVPLTLALLALLWIQDHEKAIKIKTITQLYHLLTDFILKRLGSRLDISHQFLCRDWMLVLGEVAWINLQKNQHHLSDEDVVKLMKAGLALGVDGNEALSSFLRSESQTSLTDCSQVWTFTHNSQQEYLAAEFTVHDAIENKKSLSDILGFRGEAGEEKKLQRLMQIIEFIVGLLAHKNEIKERASEITRIISVQAPWSFMAVRRIARDLLKSNQECQEVFQNMFAQENVASFLDGYNPECVHWVLENTSLGIPPHVRLRNPISDVLKMAPLLKLLVKKRCHPEVVVALDHADSVSKAISFMEGLGEPLVKFILLTWNSHSLCELVKKWPWPRPLHLFFPREVFPLLWWELMMYLTVGVCCTPATLVHSSSDPRCAQLVEGGAHALGAACQVDDTLDAEAVVIRVNPSSSG